MWSAALHAERLLALTGGRPDPRRLPPWLLSFAQALVERREPVLDLLEDETGRPRPRWIRMTLYQYRFAESGPSWWRRQDAGVLLPPVRLES